MDFMARSALKRLNWLRLAKVLDRSDYITVANLRKVIISTEATDSVMPQLCFVLDSRATFSMVQ